MSSVILHRHAVKKDQVDEIVELCHAVLGNRDVAPLGEVYWPSHLAASRVPSEIRDVVQRSIIHEKAHAVVVSIDPAFLPEIPDCPKTHRPPGLQEEAGFWDVLALVMANVMGYPFTWSSIQNGYLQNDVIPVAGFESELSSRSSKIDFGLHTEDAFSSLAGEILALQCRYNDAQAATTLAAYDSRIVTSDFDRLFESEFQIMPNVSHHEYSSVERQPLLYGLRDKPYFRINAAQPILAPDTAEGTVKEFIAMLEDNIVGVVLEPGDHLVVDNTRVAHGRSRFKYSADDHNRWLRRLYVASDLRRSRHRRSSAESWLVEAW
ncbi:MAG: TauD/TfdA family dioxygenase [Micrococcales bacterium]|nr:TauD/TfdA family dioxygenase [Micrococcales bacterium]